MSEPLPLKKRRGIKPFREQARAAAEAALFGSSPTLSEADAAAIFGEPYRCPLTGQETRIDFTPAPPPPSSPPPPRVRYTCSRPACGAAFDAPADLAAHMARNHVLNPREAAMVGRLLRTVTQPRPEDRDHEPALPPPTRRPTEAPPAPGEGTRGDAADDLPHPGGAEADADRLGR